MPEREDWFVPIGGTHLLHLDLAHVVMAGPKFSKSYPTLALSDLQSVPVEWDGLSVSVVHPRDAAQIALVRFAFNNDATAMSGSWIRADRALERMLDSTIAAHLSESVILVRFEEVQAPILVRRRGPELLIDAMSLARLRRVIRRANSAGRFSSITELTRHLARKWGFGLIRRTSRVIPGMHADKRRLGQGRIVALIGPDGVGKTTQSDFLIAAFADKIRCSSVYLGSNDGSWMRIRRSFQQTRKDQGVAKLHKVKAPVHARGWLHATGSAAWRLTMGIRRFLGVRKAVRLANAGHLVITDRWPQSLAEGLLDGPSESPPPKFRIASAMWRIEKRIYNKLSAYQPTLAIHLLAPFAVSHERKPGDIERNDFGERVALMEQMREKYGPSIVVDAGQSLDAVTEQLFGHICRHLGCTE